MVYEEANKLGLVRIPVLKGEQPGIIYPSYDNIEDGIAAALRTGNVSFPQESVNSIVADLISENPNLLDKPELSKLGRVYSEYSEITGSDDIVIHASAGRLYFNQLAECKYTQDINIGQSSGITAHIIVEGNPGFESVIGYRISGTPAGPPGFVNDLTLPISISPDMNNHILLIGNVKNLDVQESGTLRIFWHYESNNSQVPIGDAMLVKFTDIEETLTIELGALVIPNGSADVEVEFYPQVFDLTEMFGSDLADYVYSLEQEETGAGIAWFREIFPKDYYPYWAGSEAPEFYDVPGSYFPVDSSLVSVEFPWDMYPSKGKSMNVSGSEDYPIVLPDNMPQQIIVPASPTSGYANIYTFMLTDGFYYYLGKNNFSVSISQTDANKNGRILPSSMPNYQIFKAVTYENIVSGSVAANTVKKIRSLPIWPSTITSVYVDGENNSWTLSGFVPLGISRWSMNDGDNIMVIGKNIGEEPHGAFDIEFNVENAGNNATSVSFDVDILGYFTEITDT